MSNYKIILHKLFTVLSVSFGWYLAKYHDGLGIILGLGLWLIIFLVFERMVKIEKRSDVDNKKR